MKDLPFFKKPEELIAELQRLHKLRIRKKDKNRRTRRSISSKDRKRIYEKAGGRCHICGGSTSLGDYEADHVFPQIGGGTDDIENYLPSHKLCNNYRWFYESNEIKWILKIGVWARTEIENDTKSGREIADRFIKKELSREKRRRKPRVRRN